MLGLSPDIVTTVNAALEAEDLAGTDSFDLWPQNARAIARFVACGTQWRVAGGFGGISFIGLDYAAAKVVFDGEGLDMTPDDWRSLRICETAAAVAMNEARS